MTNSADYLKEISLFATLDDEIIKKIAQAGYQQSFSKNTVILIEEDFGGTLFFIVKGKVKVSRSSNDGREVILNLLGEHDFFGEMSILDGDSRSATVSAVEDSVLFILKRDDFLSFLTKYPGIAIALITELTARLREANLQIKSLSLNDAEGKIATVLIQLAMDEGIIKNGIVEIQKLPVQHELANMASVSRETVSRILHNFVKKDLIELEGNSVRIKDFENFRSIYR